MTERINLPVPIKTHGPIKQINDILEKKGGEVLDWLGTPILYRFFYLYLFKKYKHNCRLYSYKFLGIDLGGSFNSKLKYDLLKHAQQFKKCYDSGSDMIVIPIRYSTSPTSGHANFLLFKRAPHIIERFEPYGQLVRDKPFVDESINYFINKINKLLSHPIRYSPVEESCHEIGIQYREEYIEPQKKEAKEGIGYCVIWSMFFAELSLANPSLNIKQLTDIIYSIKKTDFYLRDIARGYVYFFYEKMDKYFSRYLSPIMTFQKFIQNINTKNVIIRKHINDAHDALNELFNIEMELYENPNLTIEELNQSNNDLINDLTIKYSSAHPVIKNEINRQITKLYIKGDILLKMIRNKDNLNKFTPLHIIEEDPNVLVMDVRSSNISKVATPLEQTKVRRKLRQVKDINARPPCKPGKERNANGRCVKTRNANKPKSILKEKTLKVRPPCKPGKERNANGRCVKIKVDKSSTTIKNIHVEKIILPNIMPEELSSLSSDSPIVNPFYVPTRPIQKQPCKPGKERNANGRCVKIKTTKVSTKSKNKSKTLRTKQPCKPGKTRNTKGRCVKIENIK